ncbi:GH16 domain-containing protein [Mycena venus]|uniref:GH16 domain-containing protein n=1 Tax=Mycena venus TaxID=2733690 RepID=A0A8H6XE98_9AGAR|nr:GH16 domain-containing protein [Mycena venus]
MAAVARGNVILQPSYFTSSVYVKALRDDITTLVLNFHEQYKEDSTKPFALFKTLWNAQGWKWMHFKVFDSRTRETFLNMTVRLFLERMVKTEAPFTRTVAHCLPSIHSSTRNPPARLHHCAVFRTFLFP